MKPVNSWNFTPYAPLDRPERLTEPYICRIAPGMTTVDFDFIDPGAKPKTTHTLYYRTRGTGEYKALELDKEMHGQLYGLRNRTDYEFYVERDTDGVRSAVRLARTSVVPGKVVNYLHPEDPFYGFSGQYLCSPSLIRLPGGRLLSSMDVFEGNKPQNLTILFSSDDDGKSWQYLTELFPCFWGEMFYENGRLYMLAVSDEYGDLLIGASDNEGRDWTLPTVLFRGSSSCIERGLHRAPMRLTRHAGRLWTDVEYGAWAKQEMNNAVLSAPEGCADYTDPAVWSMTSFWRHNDHKNEEGLNPACVGGIEGNVVAAPDGSLYDFLRYENGKCLLLRIDPDQPEGELTYAGVVPMEINASKFEICFDEESGDYFALCSRRVTEGTPTNRNLLSLFRSHDLRDWRCTADILDAKALDPQIVGFQYVSFLIEGDDILFLSRTAYGKPHNFHDSNYQTFHRIAGFRDL